MNWVQLAYQYGIGGAFFFVTMYFCTRLGSADWKNPSDRRSIILLLAAFFGFFLATTGWILAVTP